MGQQAVVTPRSVLIFATAQQVDPVTSPLQSCLGHAASGQWVQSQMFEPKSGAPSCGPAKRDVPSGAAGAELLPGGRGHSSADTLCWAGTEGQVDRGVSGGWGRSSQCEGPLKGPGC